MTRSEKATKDDALKAGREAYKSNDWSRALELLSAADAQEPLAAEDLERLGDAAMWAMAPEECIGAYERAYAAYIEAGQPSRAAHAGRHLIIELDATQGRESVTRGWINRIVRLLKDEPEGVEHGYLAYVQSQRCLGVGDVDKAYETAQRAFELGGKFGDRDLQGLGLHTQGLALVAKGEVAEGMALLDEAAAGAVAGELGMLASATIYCNIVGTSRNLSDYGRASDWIDAAKRWCDRTAIATYPGTCRVHRAEVMRLRGVWAEAEADAQKAADELRHYPVMAREAFYELGEIRLRTGDLKLAEEALRQAHEMGREPQPGLALVRLAQGQTAEASAMMRRALAEPDSNRLARARLLPAQVEITLAMGDSEAALAAVEEMEGIAATYGTSVLRALAGCARGALQMAEGEAAAALGSLRQSLRLWQEIDAPYEGARARVAMAAAYRASGDDASARLELDAALSAFERLGAALDTRRVRELLETGAGDGGRSVAPSRATKTFMFSDIVNSTPLIGAIGDLAWNDLLNWHDKTLRSLFSAHAGEEFKHGGDGFAVAFESARAAVDCAVAIQSSLAEHRRNHGFALQVRIGLHTSEATRRGTDYGGKGVHAAARIGGLAGAEEIIACLETVEAAGVSASEPRSVTLKGISEPVRVVAINWR